MVEEFPLRVHAAIERAVGLARWHDEGGRPSRRWSDISPAGAFAVVAAAVVLVALPVLVARASGKAAIAVVVVEILIVVLAVVVARRDARPRRPSIATRSDRRRFLALTGEALAVAARDVSWDRLELTADGPVRELRATRTGLAASTVVPVTPRVTAALDQLQAVTGLAGLVVGLDADGTTTLEAP